MMSLTNAFFHLLFSWRGNRCFPSTTHSLSVRLCLCAAHCCQEQETEQSAVKRPLGSRPRGLTLQGQMEEFLNPVARTFQKLFQKSLSARYRISLLLFLTVGGAASHEDPGQRLVARAAVGLNSCQSRAGETLITSSTERRSSPPYSVLLIKLRRHHRPLLISPVTACLRLTPTSCISSSDSSDSASRKRFH